MSEPKSYLRPGFVMRRLVGPLAIRSGRLPVLTVTGRSSGLVRSVPIGKPVEVEGRRYLLSARGQTQWIRNLRAAGCGTLRVRGVTESFRAVEVEGAERDRAIAAYRAWLGKSVERGFKKLPNAADHPTFRLDDVAVVSAPKGKAG